MSAVDELAAGESSPDAARLSGAGSDEVGGWLVVEWSVRLVGWGAWGAAPQHTLLSTGDTRAEARTRCRSSALHLNCPVGGAHGVHSPHGG